MSAEVPGPGARGWKVYGDRALGHHIISQQRLCDTLIADTQMGHSVSMGNTDTDPALICGDGSKECLMERECDENSSAGFSESNLLQLPLLFASISSGCGAVMITE